MSGGDLPDHALRPKDAPTLWRDRVFAGHGGGYHFRGAAVDLATEDEALNRGVAEFISEQVVRLIERNPTWAAPLRPGDGPYLLADPPTGRSTMPPRHEPPTAPHNPYRRRSGGMEVGEIRATPSDGMAMGHARSMPSSDVYDRAQGIALGDLDDLARSRWVDGHQAGHEDGTREASERYADIFDEGWRVGHAEGWGLAGSRFGDRLHRAHELAATVVELPPKDMPVVWEALRAIGGLLGAGIAEYNRGPDGDAKLPAPDGMDRLAALAREGAPEEPDAERQDRQREKAHALIRELREATPPEYRLEFTPEG